MALTDVILAAPAGTTGNNTGNSIRLPDYLTLAAQFVVEVAGATPTVTWKFQGSIDGTNWYDLAYVTDASDTISAATRTATAVGAQVNFADLANTSRKYKFVRCVTTANTNITYRAEIYTVS